LRRENCVTVTFELFGYFRAMTGKGRLQVELDEANGLTVLKALEVLDKEFKKFKFSIMKNGDLKPGVVVFLKEPSGKTVRAGGSHTLSGDSAPVLVLSNLMEGG